MQEDQKKCKRGGCNKKYFEKENNPEACKYHPGKPIFHDCKKGWTCCNKIAYDWDEFQKIQGCMIGPHSDVKETIEFFQSNTVNNAQTALNRNPNEPKPLQPKSIDEYNREQAQKKEAEEKAKKEMEMILFITKNNKLKCTNKGCN